MPLLLCNGGGSPGAHSPEDRLRIFVEKQYYNTSSWQNVEGTEVVEGYNTIPGSYTDENFRYNDGTLLPLWDGTEQPDLINPFDVIQGNGVFTLTQTDEKYSDENGAIYFQANADFILNFNELVRHFLSIYKYFSI